MASNIDRVYEFIAEPDDALTCRICLEVARDPWQHGECGMLFCEQCIKKYGRDKACPHCRMERPQYFKDNKSKRDIKSLRVRCDNAGKGCKWKGTVGTLDDHVTKVCQFIPLPCPNKCKDDKWTVKCFMKKDLKVHLKLCPNREHQCEYCGKKDTYVSITKEHDKICEKKRIFCVNSDCHMTIERGKMDAHVANDCEYTEISCKYESIGCGVKIKRRDMRAHEEEDDKVHLRMALDTIIKFRETTEKLTNTTEKLEKELRNTPENEKTEKLRNITEGLEEKTEKLRNVTEELEEKIEGLREELEEKIEGLREELEEKTEELKNMTEKLEETTAVLEGRSNMCSPENMVSMTFKVPDFLAKKVNNECFLSPSFYTSPTGYHMYFRVHPNGCQGNDGSSVGTHISVMAVIMKGKYDEKLKWPLIGKVSIELLNQLEDKKHYKVNLKLTAKSNLRVDGNTNWGFIQFIPLWRLQCDLVTGAQYLKDDTLYFRVSVEVSNDKPWLECTASD